MKILWFLYVSIFVGVYAQDVVVDPESNNNNSSSTFQLPCPDGYGCYPSTHCSNILSKDDPAKGTHSLKCPMPTEVCCSREEIENRIQNRTLTTTAPTEYRASSDPSSCGFRNIPGIISRLGNTEDSLTRFAEFPWMVAILEKNFTEDGEERNIYRAGGSLIHPAVVLTAAHRISGFQTNTIRIRAGEWDVTTKGESIPHQERDIGQVVIHPDYDSGSLKNDIAILFLTEPLELVDNVKTICLPPQDAKFDRKECIATGWGKDAYSGVARYSPILKKVDLPVIPLDHCEALLRNTRLSKYFELHDSFVCAGGEPGKDTCNGDGGSPLVCPSESLANNQYYQVGIVAWGIGCAQGDIPAVYVNIAKFRTWIDKVVTDKGLSIDSYTA